MKNVEKKALNLVKMAVKKQSVDPKIPGCQVIYHQPKRPKK